MMAEEKTTTAAPSRFSDFMEDYFSVLLTVFIGICFSIGVFFVVRWWETRTIRDDFRKCAEERAGAVKNNFQIELAMLKLVMVSLAEDGRVEKDEFAHILKPFHTNDANIEAVEWIPHVSGAKRMEFEEAARKAGFEDFRITEQNRKGKMISAGQRGEYYPIYFCGPRPAAPGIVGYDVGSEPVRLEALHQACDTGEATASGRIVFVNEDQESGGFLVILPVYEKDKPTSTIEERRKNLMGFVMGVYRANSLLDTAVTRLRPEGINIGLFDASKVKDGGKIDFRMSRLSDEQFPTVDVHKIDISKKLYYSDRLNVAGHPWTIACLATPEFTSSRRTWWPLGMSLIGLAFTAMIGVNLIATANRNAQLEQKVREQTADLRYAQEEVICKLVSASQWCDEETGMHIRRTGLLSEALAKAAGWYGDDVDAIRQAAPMHDIGKIGIPDAILKKPGKLTPDEFEIMKTHTRIGAAILSDSTVPMLQMAKDIALNHHERWDGSGYPHGLSGKAIPEAARIVAIVDVYDALSHDRVYRKAMPEAETLKIIREESGKQFDPTLVTAFFRCLPELRRILANHPDEVLRDEAIRNFVESTVSTSSEPPLPGVTFPAMPGAGVGDTIET